MDGCVWMVLDDVLFIVHVINNGLAFAVRDVLHGILW
jgi:hypothetical protein